MLMLSVSETCLVVDVSDRSGAWTPEALDVVNQIAEQLAGDGWKATQVVAPSYEQDYDYAQRNRVVQQVPTHDEMCEIAAR